MHHIYHTEGFILSSKNVGEANKSFTIYTEKLGLVKATAQGVRLSKSKLRFALQDFTHIKLDLVKGRDIWRITSAQNISSFPLLRRDRDSLRILYQISKLIERLYQGEESNIKIFQSLIQSFILLDVEKIEKNTKEALELYLVLNIMNALGYIGESKMINDYLSVSFDPYKIEKIIKDRKPIIFHINKALNESQM